MIGLYTSYAAPIFLRITYGKDRLAPGPFSLGRWATPVGAIAVAWVSFIVVMLFFPPGQNPTAEEMSRSLVILGTIRLLNNFIKTTQWLSSWAFSYLHLRRGFSQPESGSLDQ